MTTSRDPSVHNDPGLSVWGPWRDWHERVGLHWRKQPTPPSVDQHVHDFRAGLSVFGPWGDWVSAEVCIRCGIIRLTAKALEQWTAPNEGEKAK